MEKGARLKCGRRSPPSARETAAKAAAARPFGGKKGPCSHGSLRSHNQTQAVLSLHTHTRTHTTKQVRIRATERERADERRATSLPCCALLLSVCAALSLSPAPASPATRTPLAFSPTGSSSRACSRGLAALEQRERRVVCVVAATGGAPPPPLSTRARGLVALAPSSRPGRPPSPKPTSPQTPTQHSHP